MSDDEHPVPSVGGSDTASWNKHRLDGISVTFKVVADALKGKGFSQLVSSNTVERVEKSWRTCHLRYLALLDHREDSSNVLSNNPIGSDLVNAAEHVRPEVAVILRAASLPGITEWLTRKSASENVDSSSPLGEVCCGDVFITFTVWVPIIEHSPPERSCLCRCKDTKFFAIHNDDKDAVLAYTVVYAGAKIRNFLQFTTVGRRSR